MNANLKLEPPFYFPEALDQFVRPILPDLVGTEVSLAALDDSALCEALNRALKLTIERTQ